jgi:HSP20 family protein
MNNLPDIWREFDRPLTSSFGSWRPLLRQLDDFMNEALGSGRMLEDTRTMAPAVDIEESEDHYLMSFDMPGLEADNIDIEVQGNQLVVSAERKAEREGREGRAQFKERRYGRFQRVMTLPDAVKADQVEAQYRNGVLTVAVPKPEESKRQKIKIGEGKGGILQKLLGSEGKKEKETINVKAGERPSESAPPH